MTYNGRLYYWTSANTPYYVGRTMRVQLFTVDGLACFVLRARFHHPRASPAECYVITSASTLQSLHKFTIQKGFTVANRARMPSSRETRPAKVRPGPSPLQPL